MAQYNHYTGTGGGDEFWTTAQDTVEDAGGDPDDLVGVTLESEGTSGDFQVTDMSLRDGWESDEPAEEARAWWDDAENISKALVVGMVLLVAGTIALGASD